MERDAQEREQPVSADHYRKRTGVLTNVIYDTAAVLQGKPIDGDWDTQSLFRMAERVVSRAEAAESRVRELEAALVDIEKRCGWLRDDIRERDKVLCHELSIRCIIAQVHSQYARAALDGDGKKGGENEHVAYTNPAPTF